MTVREGATALGNSRALAYELVARGEIPAIRLGHRIVVPTQRLKDLVLGRGCASGVLEDTTESSKIGERPPFATAPERRLCHTLEIKLRDFWIFLTDERSCGGNCDPRRAVIARNQDNEALGSSTTAMTAAVPPVHRRASRSALRSLVGAFSAECFLTSGDHLFE